MTEAIRSNGHSNARRAGEDAKVESPIGHIASDEIGVVGIINRFMTVSSEVLNFVPQRDEVLDDCVFKIDGAVIGSDGNAESGMAHELFVIQS